MTNDDCVTVEGRIVKVLPACKYQVQLSQFKNHELVAYPCGKINSRKIKLVVGDKVIVEMSKYDLNNGRIMRRI